MTTQPSSPCAVYYFDLPTERLMVGPKIAPNVLGEVFYIYRMRDTWEAFTSIGDTSRLTMQRGDHPWGEWLRVRNDEILKQLERMYQGEAPTISAQQWLQYRTRTTHPDDIKDRKP